jgi:hypothetical protein
VRQRLSPLLWRELAFVELFALGIRGKLFAYLYCCPLFIVHAIDNGMMSLKCGLEPLAEGRWSDTRGAMTGVAGAPVVHNVNAARIAMSVKIYAFGCGIPLQNGAVIHSLHYADDVDQVLMCCCLRPRTPAELQQLLLLDVAGRRSYEDQFIWSPPKSIVVVFGHEGDDNDLCFSPTWRADQSGDFRSSTWGLGASDSTRSQWARSRGRAARCDSQRVWP